MCVEPIPLTGTHTITAISINSLNKTNCYIGIATEDIRLNMGLCQNKSWAYWYNGCKYIDRVSTPYGICYNNKTVRVEVNWSEGWLNFYVNDEEQGNILDLPLYFEEDIYFAFSIFYEDDCWTVID